MPRFRTALAAAAVATMGLVASAPAEARTFVSVGVGTPGYYPAYGYGYPGYYGWYGGFYYPGSGGFVYDRYRRPYRWNGAQRRYWSGQQRAFGGDHGGRNFRPGANWGGFNHGAAAGGGFNRPAGQAFRGGGAHMGGRTGGGGGRHR